MACETSRVCHSTWPLSAAKARSYGPFFPSKSRPPAVANPRVFDTRASQAPQCFFDYRRGLASPIHVGRARAVLPTNLLEHDALITVDCSWVKSIRPQGGCCCEAASGGGPGCGTPRLSRASEDLPNKKKKTSPEG